MSKRKGDLLQGTLVMLIPKTLTLGSIWGVSENNRQAKYYSLTQEGEQH